jgi:hypothetical protein
MLVAKHNLKNKINVSWIWTSIHFLLSPPYFFLHQNSWQQIPCYPPRVNIPHVLRMAHKTSMDYNKIFTIISTNSHCPFLNITHKDKHKTRVVLPANFTVMCNMKLAPIDSLYFLHTLNLRLTQYSPHCSSSVPSHVLPSVWHPSSPLVLMLVSHFLRGISLLVWGSIFGILSSFILKTCSQHLILLFPNLSSNVFIFTLCVHIFCFLFLLFLFHHVVPISFKILWCVMGGHTVA